MSAKYYCLTGDTEAGPYDKNRIRKLIKLGQLRKTDLVRRDGKTKWRPIESVNGLLEPKPKSQPEKAPSPQASEWRQAGKYIAIFLGVILGIGGIYAAYSGARGLIRSAMEASADDITEQSFYKLKLGQMRMSVHDALGGWPNSSESTEHKSVYQGDGCVITIEFTGDDKVASFEYRDETRLMRHEYAAGGTRTINSETVNGVEHRKETVRRSRPY